MLFMWRRSAVCEVRVWIVKNVQQQIEGIRHTPGSLTTTTKNNDDDNNNNTHFRVTSEARMHCSSYNNTTGLVPM